MRRKELSQQHDCRFTPASTFPTGFGRTARLVLLCGLFLLTNHALHATTVPVILGVGPDTVTVRTGSHPGHPVKDAATGKVVQGASNVETYKVNRFTTIVVNGLPAKLQEVHPGMRVTVITGMDRQIASQITASAIPAALPPRIYGTRTLSSVVDAHWIVAKGDGTITVAQRGAGYSSSYKITGATQVLMNDKPALAERLRVGMKVIVSAGLDPTIAGRIQAYDER